MSQAESIYTRQAGVADLALLVPLFDAYRVFYGRASDVAVARTFLLERFQHNQSVLFIALQSDGTAVGFTQLYPSFSSVSAARTFILNDLFVVSGARRSGVAVKLLEAAAHYGRAVGAIRLSLSTAIDNETAQALYVSQGWVRDTKFYAYSLSL
ncbi:MAG: GNAT family N-acetyltransferase [Gammaproteobacteria bacterium]